MKLFSAIVILLISAGCSFDNKTGIWKSDTNLSQKNSDLFIDFKTISNNKNSFKKIIKLKDNYNFVLPKIIINNKWEDVYYNQFNNLENFSYNNSKKIIFKSRKISKNNLNNYFLHDQKNLIFTDQKGNIIIFSIEENNIVFKFNFYKKNYKNVKKNLNIVIEKNIIYTTDNLGFIYALDYINKKILWAINNKIPFRSNLKIRDNKIVAADQNNNILFIDKDNGKIVELIPTEDSSIKNDFKNNFSLNKNLVFILNTYGSLYAIDKLSNEIRWVVNLNQSLDISANNLFNGNPIINNEELIVVTTHRSTYIINSYSGAIIYKFNIISQIKPFIVNDYLFLISANNLLICINIKNGEIIY